MYRRLLTARAEWLYVMRGSVFLHVNMQNADNRRTRMSCPRMFVGVGGDIFSKSVEKQGRANRTFAQADVAWTGTGRAVRFGTAFTFRQKIPDRVDLTSSDGHSCTLPRAYGDLIAFLY